MRLRRRAAGLLLGAGVLFIIGTNVQAGWLFVLAALLLGALAAGMVLPLAALRGLHVELIAPDETRQHGEASIDLAVWNRGRVTRWGVVAHDAHLGGACVFVGTVRPGERVVVTTVRYAPRRGEAHTAWVELRSAAPFGVAERRARRAADARTLVLPQVWPLGPLGFVDTAVATEPAARTEPRRGHGPDYLTVRHYRPGDPMRQVHWGLTARHGQLMVREMEEERTPRLAVFVDTEGGDAEALDGCCAVAASIIDAATATGAGVRCVAAVQHGLDVVTRRHHLELQRWLARLSSSGTAAATAIGWLGDGAVWGVGTLVLIFPVWAGRRLQPVCAAIEDLRALGIRVVAVPVLAGDEALDWRPLRAAGAEVFSWRAGSDLDLALGGVQPAVRAAVGA